MLNLNVMNILRQMLWPAGWRAVTSALILAALETQPAFATTTVAFGNGIEFMPSGLTNYNLINGVRASGFNTMVIFAMSVDANGNFIQSGQVICTNGVYTGGPRWGGLLAQCKVTPTSVNRIEMCIGGWGDQSFLNIKNRIAADGTNSAVALYKNLIALKNTLGIDAIDFDDEYEYDSASAIPFGKMCASAGLKITLCPYTNPSFWTAVKSGLGGGVDYIYLQGYSGGAGNDPGSWASSLGVPISQVFPGDWDADGDLAFLDLMQGWESEGCTGGFYWPLNSGGNPPASSTQLALYAVMIHAGLKASVFWQGGTAGYSVNNNWTGGVVPGANANAVNDSGSNNVVEINSGDPAWNVNGLWAGSASNATGAYVQNGSTVNANSADSWFRLGGELGAAGYYTLNAGTLNLSDNLTVLGEGGTGVLNINGGMALLGYVFMGVNSNSAGVLNLNGALLNVLGITGGLGSNVVNLLAGGATFNSPVDGIISAVLAGSGGLTKTGSGRLTLTELCSFTGPTVVNGGALAVNTGVNDGILDDTASLTINNGGTVLVSGDNALFGFGNHVVPVTINASGTLTISNSSTANIKGAVYLNGGTLGSADAGQSPYGTWNLDQGTVTTMGGPTTSTISAQNVLLASPTTFNIPAGATNGIDLNVSGYFYGGGVVKTGTGVMQFTGTNTYSGGTTISAGTLQLGDGISLNGVVTNSIMDNGTLVFANPLDQSYSNIVSGSGAVSKLGAGKLTVSQIHTYTGNTTIGAGTLVLAGFGSTGSSALIAISNGAVVDVTGRVGQVLSISSGKTLKGSGTILGKLTAAAGSTVSPGDAIGTLTVQSNITLSGTLLMELNRTNSQIGDELVSSAGTITGGGTLTVTNLGPALQLGDTFQLFNKPVGGFSAINLPKVPPYGWANNLAVNGTIKVAPASTMATNVSFQVTGGSNLILSWPSDHTGWQLQCQTNSLTGTNWVSEPASNTTNQLAIPIDPANASTFFRLSYPD